MAKKSKRVSSAPEGTRENPIRRKPCNCEVPYAIHWNDEREPLFGLASHEWRTVEICCVACGIRVFATHRWGKGATPDIVEILDIGTASAQGTTGWEGNERFINAARRAGVLRDRVSP